MNSYVTEESLAHATRVAFMAEYTGYVYVVDMTKSEAELYLVLYEDENSNPCEIPTLVKQYGELTSFSYHDAVKFIRERSIPEFVVIETKLGVSIIGEDVELIERSTALKEIKTRLENALTSDNLISQTEAIRKISEHRAKVSRDMAAKRLELKNAVEAYDVSGEKEFASHIRKINKAVKRGKRHAFLIYQKPENIRVEHAKKLVNAGYDIFIEKDELDGYIVLVKWLEKKETGGRVYQEGLPEDEVELFRNM